MARALLGVASLLLAEAALAHPGHGAESASWLHGLEFAHLAPALFASAVLAVAAALRMRRAASRERRR